MTKKPETIKDCVEQLIYVMEEIYLMDDKDKAFHFNDIRNYLMAYLKLKQWVNDESNNS